MHADSKPVINEFLPHPSNGNEWIELYVPDGVVPTDYWIDDDTDFITDSGNSDKKRITSVNQGSDSNHVVFDLSSSMFNNSGDTIALFSTDGILVDQYTYTSDPGRDISIGRSPDGTGDFQIMFSATRGSPNSSPKPPDTPIPTPTSKPTPTDKPVKPTETPKPSKNISFPTSIGIKPATQVLADSTVATGTDGLQFHQRLRVVRVRVPLHCLLCQQDLRRRNMLR